MTTEITGKPADTELVGYEAAGAYVGVSGNTLSSCVSAGTGPDVHKRIYVGQYRRPVFLASELERWVKNRPGKGARTDRMHAGAGNPCPVCTGGTCKVSL
jgi:hypothetical protein